MMKRPSLREAVNLEEKEIQTILAQSDQPVVRFLLGGAAWLASLFFLMFLFATELLDLESTRNQLILGIIFTATAISARLLIRQNLLVEQMTLPMSLTGQSLLILGVHSASESWTIASAAAALLELLIIVVYPDRIARLLATMGFYLAAYSLVNLEAPQLMPVLVLFCGAVVTLFVFHADRLPERMIWPARAVAMGSAVALPLLLLAPLWDEATIHLNDQLTLVLAVLLCYAIYNIAGSPWHWLLIGVTLIVLFLARSTPGLGSGLLLLTLGFQGSHRPLMGWGVLTSGLFLFFFYYNMESTLLLKSIALMSTGIALLLLRAGLWGLERRG